MKSADPSVPRVVRQLSLFLENKPGALAAACDALAEARINIFALTISDTTDHSVVRMVVGNTEKALALFEARGALVIETDVLMFQGDNRPGGLSRIAMALAEKKINIDYAYLTSLPTTRKGLMIMKVTDAAKALGILKRMGPG
jgi:hypothetical protein